MSDPAAHISIRDELLRKSIHLAALWIPIGYVLLPDKYILIPLSITVTFALFVEIFRTANEKFEYWFESLLGTLLRPRERKNVTGATTMLVSALLSILFFEQWIAILAMLLMLVSDAIGALVGRLWGKRTYRPGRTVEGSAAFLVSGFLLIPLVPDARIPICAAGVIAGLIFEVGIIKLDDNIAVPLGAGICMEVLHMIFPVVS